jgi:hypothetical protein
MGCLIQRKLVRQPLERVCIIDVIPGLEIDHFDAMLFWSVGAYGVIYRAERRPGEVVAVTQGSRDIPAFLQRRVPG